MINGWISVTICAPDFISQTAQKLPMAKTRVSPLGLEISHTRYKMF